LPDILSEAKWELDWFFSMQEKDGGVHHLIVTPEFYMGPAQFDPQTRYLVTVSTAATADFAAIMALASKVYKPYLPTFADSCLAAAENAWSYLVKTPDIFPSRGYSDPPGINGTGAYGDTNDKDERLWASAELFAATKNETYRKYFENKYSDFFFTGAGSWSSVSNYAFYTWFEATSDEANNYITKTIKDAIIKWADNTAILSERNGFGVALNKNSYSWGSNSVVLNTGMEMLIINNLLHSQKYTNTAMDQLNYILGCNSLNFCFLSGFGSNGVKDPHQCINSYDDLAQAPPGFVPGGPNSYIDKWDIALYNYVTQNNLPPAQCYLDKHESFSSNEVCVVYNSGLVMLSGILYNASTINGLSTLTNKTKEKILDICPNPAVKNLSVSVPENYIGATIELYTISGEKIIEERVFSIPQNIDISGLSECEYYIILVKDKIKVDSCKIIKAKS
jgi:endoglucanase